jgi:HTH-type transcriptional regulator, glycine betaine synthesis regulator
LIVNGYHERSTAEILTGAFLSDILCIQNVLNAEDDMHRSLVDVNDSTVAGLGRLAHFFGFSEVMGRLYGALLLHPGPLSLDELAEQLQISKGSVSMNMRALERWGIAREVWMRGERRKFYTAEADFWKVIRNVLSGREMREVQMAVQVLSESVTKLRAAEGELTPEEKKLAAFYLERVAELHSFFQFAQMALETVIASYEDLDFEDIKKIEIG